VLCLLVSRCEDRQKGNAKRFSVSFFFRCAGIVSGFLPAPQPSVVSCQNSPHTKATIMAMQTTGGPGMTGMINLVYNICRYEQIMRLGLL
jgi:hypothetical protein